MREFYEKVILDNSTTDKGLQHYQVTTRRAFGMGAYVMLQDSSDQIVGQVGIEPAQDEKTRANLQLFAVSREAQGLGVGKVLLEFALALSKSLGFKTIIVSTASNHCNEPLRKEFNVDFQEAEQPGAYRIDLFAPNSGKPERGPPK